MKKSKEELRREAYIEHCTLVLNYILTDPRPETSRFAFQYRAPGMSEPVKVLVTEAEFERIKEAEGYLLKRLAVLGFQVDTRFGQGKHSRDKPPPDDDLTPEDSQVSTEGTIAALEAAGKLKRSGQIN